MAIGLVPIGTSHPERGWLLDRGTEPQFSGWLRGKESKTVTCGNVRNLQLSGDAVPGALSR